MANDWSAGLTDQDELGQFPSAASPLNSLGIDPDMARANPEILSRLGSGGSTSDRGSSAAAQSRLMRSPGGAPAPGETTGPSPSAAAAGAVGGAGISPTPDDPETVGMSALTTSLGNESKLASQVPTSDPDTARLTAQHEKLATPAPLYDPQTGKMLAEDKPSLGTRVWRGVRGGLVGGLTGGIPGAIVGAIEPGKIAGGQAYGAPNKTYQRNEQRREQQLEATDTSLENARKNWKDQVEAMKTKGAILGDVTKTGSDIVSGSAKLQGAETKALLEQATAENYKSKAEEAKGKLQEQINKDLQTASTNEERIQAMRDRAAMMDQIHQMELRFKQQELSTKTDAKSIDQWQKEQIDSINKDYSGITNSIWNRITAGSKQDRITQINKTADDRRAAMGLPTGVTGGAPPASGAPSGKGVSLAQARQLPQYRGKSDAEIAAEIKKYGHQVTP